MVNNNKVGFYAVILLSLLYLTTCNSTPQVQEETQQYTVISPCNVDRKMIGQDIIVAGNINAIDDTLTDGTWMELSFNNCEVEAFIEKEVFEEFGDKLRSEIELDNYLEIGGQVSSFEENLGVMAHSFPALDLYPATSVQAPEKSAQTLLHYEITTDPTSRWQDIILTFTDDQGQPLKNEEVQYTQKDLDFMFSIEYGGMPPEMFAQEGYADLFWDLGINAFQLSPWHLWSMFEPYDDDFRWWVDYSPPSFCPEIAVGEDIVCPEASFEDAQIYSYKLPEERKPFIYGIAWVGMYFYDYENNCLNRNPDFLDCNDIDGQYRSEYEEFLRNFVEHYKDQITLYRLGLESNFGDFNGAARNKDMEWNAEWIKMQCGIIKSIDPDALISVDLLDWRSNPDAESLLRDWNAMQTGRGVKSLGMFEDEFIELLLAMDVQFDVIGIELHPGYLITFEGAQAELSLLEKYGKPIYVWEDMVPSEDEPIALKSCRSRGTCPTEGYSEEYQSQAVLQLVKILMEEHPSVIGFEYFGFRDNRDLLEPLPGPRDPDVPTTHGWVTEDAKPKLIYNTIRDYWFGLFSSGNEITDENGQITFRAIPGWFEITMNGKSVVSQITQKTFENEMYF